MVKQITVTFDFDSETDQVSNVKTINSGVAKKKNSATTKKVSDIVVEMAKEPLMTLETNRITFNNKLIADMGINYEDRIVIKWEKQGKVMIPIIGKDTAFDEDGTGNKITKSNTIAYKGKANVVLAEVGSEFTIEPHKEGIWKLISTVNSAVSNPDEPILMSTLEDALKQAEETEVDLLVNTDETTEIDEYKFKI